MAFMGLFTTTVTLEDEQKHEVRVFWERDRIKAIHDLETDANVYSVTSAESIEEIQSWLESGEIA